MYYFNNNINNNSPTTHNNSSNDNNNSEQENYHNNGPLFSQPLDPSSLVNGTPTDYIQDFDLNSYDPSNLLFNDTTLFNNNWDYYTSIDTQQQQQQQQEETILLSDPNFLRQHQLLQEQQKEMYNRLNGDEQKQVSNLSAMFDHQQQLEEEEKSAPIKMEEEEIKRQQKKSDNRKQHVLVKSEEGEEDLAKKVDHQRRFNELQARFRVNYARKPTQQQQQQQTVKSLPTTTINTTNNTTTTTTTTTNNNTTANTSNENNTNDKSLSIPTTISSPVAIGGLVMTNNTNTNDENESLSSSFPSRTMPIQIQRVARNSSSQPFDAESHQKHLDSQLDKVDFNDVTVSELKEMLRQRGKPATGKKAVLLQRLLEERETAKVGRSNGRILSNRHSQPLPFSRSVTNNNNNNPTESPQRPRSFQGTSPVMIQQQNSFNGSHSGMASPSSPSATNFLPGSPSGSLHRSIANMHIGSPPAMSRRYSPYSPRLSSSPKPSHQEYSSSVPLSSSPVNNNSIPMASTNNNNNNNNMMLSASFSVRSSRYYNNPKTYKPFTSSALATPDREEDVNPFDSYYSNRGGSADPPIKEEEDITNNNTMDWMDPNAFDMLLQQQQASQPQHNMNDISSQLPQLTNEQIIALLNNQQTNFKLDDNTFNNNSQQQQPSYYHH